MKIVTRIIDAFIKDRWATLSMTIFTLFGVVILLIPANNWIWSLLIMFLPIPVLLWIYHGVVVVVSPDKYMKASKKSSIIMAISWILVLCVYGFMKWA